jgi:hypothetical protein
MFTQLMHGGAEIKRCESCRGTGYKIVSARRSVPAGEGTYVLERKPCVDCVAGLDLKPEVRS